MFDIGFQEMAVIGIIGLIVIGPERLPRVARHIGLWVGRLRRYVNQVRDDIDREIRADELRELMNKPSEQLGDLYKVAEETKGALTDAKKTVESASRELETQVARDLDAEAQAEPESKDDEGSGATPSAPPAEFASVEALSAASDSDGCDPGEPELPHETVAAEGESVSDSAETVEPAETAAPAESARDERRSQQS